MQQRFLSSTTALFDGTDARGRQELWVTDGTAAGTHELKVRGESRYGSTPTDITPFKAGALFNGIDAAGRNELWITNGTTHGTKKLKIRGTSPHGLNPSEITVVGNKAYFLGTNSAGHTTLWVTDGTVGGTHELNKSMNLVAEPPGLPHIIQIVALEPHGVAGARPTKVLLLGYDHSGQTELWVSNGTAAGTDEIMQTSASSGLINLTMVNLSGQALFAWLDSGRDQLWTTDGTVSGTHPLNIPGASPS